MEAAWLRSEVEAPLAPEIEIIDPHHHFWEDPAFADNYGRFLPDDFQPVIEQSGHRIVATVYLECMFGYRQDGPRHLRCVGETERVDAIAEEWRANGGLKFGAGIVGAADLLLGDTVEEVLEEHMRASPTRFRGVRHTVAADPDDPFTSHFRQGVMNDLQFRKGLARLKNTGLIFETWCLHTQLREYADLARAFPDIPMVLDHLGTPIGLGRFLGKQAEVFADWRASVDELARLPNVVMKLGGLGMPAFGYPWLAGGAPPNSETIAEAYRPYVLHAVEAFSPARCMFESNFAVDGASYGYGNLWNAFKRVATPFSKDDQRALFHDTAARVYRLAI